MTRAMLYRQPKHKSLANALSLEKLTSQSGDLENLIQKANQLQQFADIVNQCFPPLFKGKLQINGLNQGTLILTSPSAALATRFRMNQNEVLALLRQRMPRHPVHEIKIRIRPNKVRQEQPKAKPTLSKENALILKEEAGHTNDKRLRDVLTKLAMHADQ